MVMSMTMTFIINMAQLITVTIMVSVKTIIMAKMMLQVKRDRKSSFAGNTSFIFPGRRVASAVHNRRLLFCFLFPKELCCCQSCSFSCFLSRSDPLVRQQVEWSVRQETGYKRRAFLVANR